MNFLVLLGLAIAPGVAISTYIYWKDKFNREPGKTLIISFVLGIFCVLPAIVLEDIGSAFLPPYGSGMNTFLYTFVVVGLSEELCKFLVLRLYSYPRREFDEPFDGITYSVMVAMGFATIENIMYVAEYGMANAFLRMFTAVPAHATFGIIMGYYVGMAKFKGNSPGLQLTGLALAIVMHGAYDFFLMVQNISLITMGAVVSLIIGIRFSRRAIRLHLENSPFRSPTVLKNDNFEDDRSHH